MKTLYLKIDGMTCSACSSSIQKSLSKKKYIKNAEVDLISKSAIIIYDENITSTLEIIKQINKLGFDASVNKDYKDNKQNEYLKDTIIAIAFAIPLFILSMANMHGFIDNIFKSYLTPYIITIIQIILLLPILYSGRFIYKKGFLSLLRGIPNMDSLVMLGSGSAILYSLYMLNKDLHDLYFESAGVIIATIMLGKILENKATQNARDGLNDLSNITPKTALKLQDSKYIEVNINDINKDDILAINKGNIVSVDGILLDNKCIIDESIISGESKHKIKLKGELIYSGSINVGEQFIIKAIADQANSMIGKIIFLMKDIKKAPIARIADSISYYFVPSVILLAICAGIVWFLIKEDIHFSFIIFTSILLISCPCALGLATPLSILVSTNIAARSAIYFKNAQSIEFTSKINVIVFDKTGTLTQGNLEVEECNINTNMDKTYILSLVYALESRSEHLIAKAILKYITENIKINSIFNIDNIETIVGKGIIGRVDDKEIKLGNENLILNAQKIDHTNIIVHINIDGVNVGYFSIKDKLRGNVKELIKKLKDLSIKPIILSGDREKSVARVAIDCGIDEYYHSCLPKDKLDFITKLQDQNLNVAFIGDGINDALALKKANIGISLGIANDIAIQNADIILINNNLDNLFKAILISKKTLRNIKENLTFAFIYNVSVIPIASGALSTFNITLNPMIAGIAMGLSSISVVLNALRLNKIKFDL